MAGLKLSIDPTGMESGGKRGETALEQLKREAVKTERAVNRSSDRMGGYVTKFAATAARTLGAAAVAYVSLQGAMQAVSTARGFNAALAETSTLIEGTPEQMEALASGARDLAKTYGTGATQQVEAYYQAISAGASSAAEATTLLDAANKLAVGGVTDVTTATGILSAAMNAYASEGLTATEASDALFVAMSQGVTTVGELSSNLGKMLPFASKLGVSFDEAAAATAALTKNAISTAEAVTSLRAVMVSVLGPSEAAKEMAKDLGIEFNVAGLKSKGLVAFMADVIEKTNGSEEALRTLFGSIEATGAAMALAGEAGGFLAENMDLMKNKAGATSVAYDKLAAGLDKRWSRAVSEAADIGLVFGNVLLTVLVPTLETAAAVLTLASDNADFFAISLGVLAAAKIPALITATISAVAWLGTMEGMFIAGAIASRGLAFAMNLIPFVAVATGITLIYRTFRDSTQAADDLKNSLGELTGAQGALEDATMKFYRNVSKATAEAMKLEAQHTRNKAASSLVLAQLELASAEWWSRGFKTDRLNAAEKAVKDLSGVLIEAEARLSAVDHSFANIGDGIVDVPAPVDLVTGSLERLKAATDGLTTGSTTAAAAEYSKLATQMKVLADAQASLAQVDARTAIGQTAIEAAKLTAELGLGADQMDTFNFLLSSFSSEGTFESQATALSAMVQYLEQSVGGAENLSTESRAVYDALVDALSTAITFAGLEMSGGISTAASEAERLAHNLGVSVSHAMSLLNLRASKVYSGRGGDPRDFMPGGKKADTQFTPAIAPRGGGGSSATQTARAYDTLISSLDPVIRATQQFEKAQNAINAALKTGQIDATEAARAYELAESRFDKATSAAQKTTGVWAEMNQVGGSALDRLIEGTGNMTGALKDMVKEMALAIAKAQLLKNVSGGSASDSLGGLIFKGLFGGFMDSGGTLAPGQSAVVGEYRPEVITATSHGTLVTSGADTARKSRGGQNMTINIDARGAQAGVAEQIEQALRQAAPQIIGQSVNVIKTNWGAFNDQFRTDGALV